MKITVHQHVHENEKITFQASRFGTSGPGDRIHIDIDVKEDEDGNDQELTLFLPGDDAFLFGLHSQLHDLADQVEELISPDAMIVVGNEQDGESM